MKLNFSVLRLTCQPTREIDVDEVLRCMMSIFQLIEKHFFLLTFVFLSVVFLFCEAFLLRRYIWERTSNFYQFKRKAKLFYPHQRKHQLVPCTQANWVASFLSLHVEKIQHTRIGANMPHAKAGEIDFFFYSSSYHSTRFEGRLYRFYDLSGLNCLLIWWKHFDDKMC